MERLKGVSEGYKPPSDRKWFLSDGVKLLFTGDLVAISGDVIGLGKVCLIDRRESITKTRNLRGVQLPN